MAWAVTLSGLFLQVSHHPPVAAAHAENDHWIYDIVSAPTTKFLGNSVDIYPVGRSMRLSYRIWTTYTSLQVEEGQRRAKMTQQIEDPQANYLQSCCEECILPHELSGLKVLNETKRRLISKGDIFAGRTRIKLRKNGEVYSLVPPNSKAHNVIVGGTWVDCYGNFKLSNVTNGTQCSLHFTPCGWFGNGRYEVIPHLVR